MFFKFILLSLIFLYSALIQAHDPFFNEYPSCQFLTKTLQKELTKCQWIGTLGDAQVFPILICQNELVLLKKETQDLTSLLSLSFEFTLTLEQLELHFNLPHYCLTPFYYSFKQNEAL